MVPERIAGQVINEHKEQGRSILDNNGVAAKVLHRYFCIYRSAFKGKQVCSLLQLVDIVRGLC